MWYDKRRQQHRAYWGKPEQLTCDEDAACECGFRLLNRFRLQGSSSAVKVRWLCSARGRRG
jgi:hypothetical protein